MQQTKTQDLLLVEQARVGNEQAFSALVRACQGTLYAAAKALLGNEQDALDAVQEAVLKGWGKLPTLREGAYFNTWMTRIVIRTAINMKSRKKHTLPLLREIPARGSRPEERMDIWRAVDSLDETTRLCTVLYYFEDLSVEQVAQAVGVRQGTVKSRLHRARGKLREVLEGYEYDG